MKHRTIAGIICLCYALMTGCETSSLEDPANVKPEEILKVSRVGQGSLKAASKDSVILEARLPKAAGPLDISFKTTLGVFPRTASKEINQYADSVKDNYRMAYVTFKPDTLPGTAFVTVEVVSQRRSITLTISK